jgi:membrane protein YqaA with SNARE-associated domain
MTSISHWLLAAGVVFGVNLLPAFGPPTWAVLVFLRFTLHLPAFGLVPLGATMAASGRYLLALGTRRWRGRLSTARRESLDALQQALTRRRGRALAGVGFFLLSPLPSSQLFIAAGLLDLRLVPVTLAFLVGRLVTYSLYLGGAALVQRSFGDLALDQLRSPWAIALQVGTLALLGVMLKVDWGRWLRRRHRGP